MTISLIPLFFLLAPNLQHSSSVWMARKSCQKMNGWHSFWSILHNPYPQPPQPTPISTSSFRSSIYAYTDAQLAEAKETKAKYASELAKRGKGEITTEIRPAAETPFFYAEDYHQQYLHTNPGGYCSMRGTGVKCVEWWRDEIEGVGKEAKNVMWWNENKKIETSNTGSCYCFASSSWKRLIFCICRVWRALFFFMDDMNKSGTMSESEKMPILVIDQQFSLVWEQVYMRSIVLWYWCFSWCFFTFPAFKHSAHY